MKRKRGNIRSSIFPTVGRKSCLACHYSKHFHLRFAQEAPEKCSRKATGKSQPKGPRRMKSRRGCLGNSHKIHVRVYARGEGPKHLRFPTPQCSGPKNLKLPGTSFPTSYAVQSSFGSTEYSYCQAYCESSFAICMTSKDQRQ